MKYKILSIYSLSVFVILLVIIAVELKQKETPSQKPESSQQETTSPKAPREIILNEVERPTLYDYLKKEKSVDQKKMIVAEKVSRPVAQILGLDPEKADYDSRMKAIGQLSTELSANDIAALRDFLTHPYNPSSQLKPLAFNAVKNDTLAKLIAQKKPVIGLGHQLVEMSQNDDLDDTWRDYSVQFFATLYEERWQGDIDPNDKERQAIIDGYKEATYEIETTLAGTALLGMDLLSKNYPEFSSEDISKISLQVLSDPATSEPSRITATLLAGQHQNKEAIEDIRRLVQIGDSVPMRLAAINALAKVGNEADASLIWPMQNDEDRLISTAAKKAIETLNQRAIHND